MSVCCNGLLVCQLVGLSARTRNYSSIRAFDKLCSPFYSFISDADDSPCDSNVPVIICDKEKGENLQLANNDELSGDDGSHVEQAGQKDVVKVGEENQEVLDVATRSKGKK